MSETLRRLVAGLLAGTVLWGAAFAPKVLYACAASESLIAAGQCHGHGDAGCGGDNQEPEPASDAREMPCLGDHLAAARLPVGGRVERSDTVAATAPGPMPVDGLMFEVGVGVRAALGVVWHGERGPPPETGEAWGALLRRTVALLI